MTLSDSKIALALAKKCLTKKQLAEKAGMSRGRLNVLLNSKNVTPATVGKIANALETEPEEIIE